jgi:hypothetical protein
MFFVFSCADGRTGRVHPFIAIRVIEMPMRVHKMFNRVATDAGQCPAICVREVKYPSR